MKTDPNVKNQLEKIVNNLGKLDGLEGSLIIDDQGNVLCHRILHDTDVSLFGPMAKVITSSSRRLLSSSSKGEIKSVLVESKRGKALFLQLGKVHLILLMETSANVGMGIISAKKAAKEINEVTKDIVSATDVVPSEGEEIETFEAILKPELKPESIESKISKPEYPDSKSTISQLEHPSKSTISQPEVEDAESSEIGYAKLEHESEIEDPKALKFVSSQGVETKKVEDAKEFKVKELVTIQAEPSDVESERKGIVETEKSQPKTSIPIIKPPITFPKLPQDVKIPENSEKRADLILDIYNALFMAMSIGASKIMGVAPARGLTKKFLPAEQCKKLLDGVDVKNNSTIDFDKIKENALKIPVEEREKVFITDFTKIITVITENYGKVMGYNAFRGMVRPEFKVITESYGDAMAELGIKENMHPELVSLFE
ncbi:roadblock/LC7 domain-containing protein [Methanobacterium paludis]|uniref:Roadblock/LC7 family protein n=1 Tax=Methanobacterium paludis (strain DSM 25820 / JCM 18151 / SWAN1) TaxID=868131 RepID=F6D3D7_METPW|nr:roadblock/LC7 domain-containing protein [Methanobacterium paludis]AEG18729.1 Roadblock/LC7 family protein [Methanobacterium paludis]